MATVGDAAALLHAVATTDPDLADVDVQMSLTFKGEGARRARGI